MKPRDLKYPSILEANIHDSIFFILREQSHNQQFWPLFFPYHQKVKIEFCSGNGDWIVDQALKYPEYNWIACEFQFERVRKIWSKMKNLCLRNLLIVAGEAYTFAKHYIFPQAVDEVFINFPDPWPKRRHEKHRLIQEVFVNELHRILSHSGKITFVTDDASYLEWAIKHFSKNRLFAFEYPDPFYITDIQDYGNSYFHELWKSRGKKIYFLQMKRK